MHKNQVFINKKDIRNIYYRNNWAQKIFLKIFYLKNIY